MNKVLIILLGAVIGGFFGLHPLYACYMAGMGQGGTAMGHDGGTMGHGGDAMGGGPMMGHGDMASHSGDNHQGHHQVLTQDQARLVMGNYLKSTKDPNLVLGQVSEEQTYFEGDVATKEGTVVDKLRVDKQTGGIQSSSQQYQ